MKKEALFPKNKTIARTMTTITVRIMVVLFLLISIGGIFVDLRGWLEEKKYDTYTDIIYLRYVVGRDTFLHYVDETKKYYEEITGQYGDDELAPAAAGLRDEEYEKIEYEMDRLCAIKDALSIALIFYDEERDRVVYVFDVGYDSQLNYEPGQWVSATSENLPNQEEMLKIFDSMYAVDYRHSKNHGWTITEFIPFLDDEHNPAGFFVYDISMNELFYKIAMYLIFNVHVGAIIITIAGAVFLMVARKRVVEPLTDIADATNDFSELDSNALMGGERVFTRLDFKKKTPKELMILREAMQKLEDSVGTSLVEINRMSKESERIKAELSFAAQIQRSMLPEIDDVIASDERFSLYATMRPATSVGGDFYDFFMVDDDRLAFLVADVSDKGMGAALFMAVSKTVISTRMRSGGTPAEVLKDADAILSEGNDEGMFVTVFLAVLNLKTGEVEACNAGHDYPYVCIRNEAGEGDYQMLRQEHGLSLAFFAGTDMPHAEFPLISWQLSPGDRIFLYTDGVNEAQGSDDIQFGESRVKDVLDKHRTDDDKTVCDSMLKEIDAFLKNESQFDDITMISLTYNGNK